MPEPREALITDVTGDGKNDLIVLVHDRSWVLLSEALHDLREDSSRNGYRTSNSYFAQRRIGQILDVLDALLQLVEHDESAFEQRVTVPSRLDALRASVKKSHSELVLKIGDNFRHSRGGNSQLCGGLGHAAKLRDSEKHVQIPQSQPAADLTVPVDFSEH